MHGGGYRGGAAVAGEVDASAAGAGAAARRVLPVGPDRPADHRDAARDALIEAARRGEDLEEDQARYVRVIEYEVPDREGDGKDELIVLVTTITDFRAAPAQALARAYHQRWEHETGNAQLKTYLRGPGRVLRSQSPDLVEQEIWGYLLTHYAISALICAAATAPGSTRTGSSSSGPCAIIRRAVGPAFPP